MAKKAAGTDAVITVEFPRTGNPWVDAGIVGLYRVLRRKPSYLSSVPQRSIEGSFLDVCTSELREDRLQVTGPTDQIQAYLEWAYDALVDGYFNVSTQKQKNEESAWNFYYDTEQDLFVPFPKKKAVGAASLLFDKAPRPAGQQVTWGANASGERTPGILPESHAHLQSRLGDFLTEKRLKPGPPAGLLIDGENQVRPKVEIKAYPGKVRGQCFLTGNPESTLVEAKETAFPLLGGSRSFVNGAVDWPRMGWKIDLVGKFVPTVAFFYHQGDELHVFFPQSNDLRRVDELVDRLATMVQPDPNLFRNFELLVGSYLQRRSEVALAFLHRVFAKVSEATNVEAMSRFDDALLSSELEPDDDESDGSAERGTEEEEPLPVISFDAVFDAFRRRGNVSFTVVSASKKGNVWMAEDFSTFRDVDRLARLFAAMQRVVPIKSGRPRPVCDPRKFLLALVDFEAKSQNRTLLREKVCAAVFRGESVLALLEQHALHVNGHSDPSKVRRVGPLLDFARLYEVDLHRGTPMEAEYKSMVDTATWLGNVIGDALALAVKPKADSKGETPAAKESLGKAKGGIHRLRKTRSVGDFADEVARLQLRYGISIPNQFLDGKTFTPDNFEEFRGFSVVAALNRFQFLTSSKGPASGSNPSSTTPTP